MSHIFLIGFMGSGKTTIGRNLSNKMEKPLVDTDAIIVKRDGRQISKIFKESGEGYFRIFETMVLKDLSKYEPSVISCGGGMATRKVNVEIMKTLGKIIYLSASPQTILERVKLSNRRPILEGNKNIEFISDLMKKRTPFYEGAADIKIDCDERSIEEITTEILHLLT